MIDESLAWASKSNSNDITICEVVVNKSYLGCNDKFELKFQGVCDVKVAFLYATIEHIGSAFDYFMFATSKSHSKLKK